MSPFREALKVLCPLCGAQPGSCCLTVNKNKMSLMSTVHNQRLRAAGFGSAKQAEAKLPDDTFPLKIKSHPVMPEQAAVQTSDKKVVFSFFVDERYGHPDVIDAMLKVINSADKFVNQSDAYLSQPIRVNPVTTELKTALAALRNTINTKEELHG